MAGAAYKIWPCVQCLRFEGRVSHQKKNISPLRRLRVETVPGARSESVLFLQVGLFSSSVGGFLQVYLK